MKKAVSIISCALFAIVVFLPAGIMISNFFGYKFELASDSIFAAVTSLLSVLAVILSIAVKDTVINKVIQVLLAILVPLSLINITFYAFFYSFGKLTAVSLAVNVGCCCYMTIKYGRPKFIKIISLALSALMIIPIYFLCFFVFIFNLLEIKPNTVVKSVASPNGTYYAEVIDSDQGALGGNTLVDVYEHKEINVIIFKIYKKPKRVYFGMWGEYANMDIYWKDDDCLIINGIKYNIK